MHDFVLLGFNEDENGRRAIDGVVNWIGGANGIYMNYRFAQPFRTHRQHIGRHFPEFQGPFTNQVVHDQITGKTDGWLARCYATNTCPKIMETFGSSEIWTLRASFMLVGTDAKADIPIPENVRRYFFAGVTHGGGRGGFSSAETVNESCVLPANPAPSAPMRSALMKQFVAGQHALMPELLGMVASTVNSYTRLVPGFWAPTHATWGVENRTCALRVIPGSEKSQRVEYRIAAADANPYLALAVALGSGLWGIEHELEPGKPISGNAYDQKPQPKSALPGTLWEAAQRLKASKAARALFGDSFVEHFAATREWEERQFRKAITDWELARYFEII
jgi:hypothetical protein